MVRHRRNTHATHVQISSAPSVAAQPPTIVSAPFHVVGSTFASAPYVP
jgi:hypothetical protein